MSAPKHEIDNFFIDFNGMIHGAAHSIIDDFGDAEAPEEAISEAIIEKTWCDTQSACEHIQPKKHIYICTDGVAPLAKINQQRKRRYLSCFSAKIKSIWDRNAISPHTAFMHRLSQYITTRVASLENVTFSDAQEPGEGEHKIFDIVSKLPEDESVCVHGLDADLIMLSLCSHKSKITLMRDSSFVNIDALRVAIISELCNKYAWPSTNQKDMIESYIVLCFLLGNDFLPHPISLNLKKGGHERLLRAAGRAFENCPNGMINSGQVSIEFLAEVLAQLQKDEDSIVLDLVQEYSHKRPNASSDPVEMYPLYNKDPLVDDILKNPGVWRQLYYKNIFKTRDTKVVKHACQQFLQGILWTYAYYKRLDRDTMYVYPYGYAPSILDLANNITTFVPSQSSSVVINPTVQLLCILPPQSIDLLPEHTHKLVEDPRYGCAYMFPSTYKVQTFLKTYLWECNPVLPFVDVSLLEATVAHPKA